jgi:ABC-type multidrug transport system fused ATPase/permease subunit
MDSRLRHRIRDDLWQVRGSLTVSGTLSALAAALATFGAWLMVPLGGMLFPDTAGSLTESSTLHESFTDLLASFVGPLTPLSVSVLLAVTYLVKNVTEYTARVITDRLAADAEVGIRKRAWQSLWNKLHVPPRTEERRRISHSLLVDSQDAARVIAIGPLRLVGDPVTAIGLLGTMLWISPVVALALLVATPLGGLMVRRGLAGVGRRAEARAHSRARLGTRLGEMLELGPVIRAFGAIHWASADVSIAERNARDASVAWIRRTRLAPAIAESVGAILGATVIWLGLREIAVGASSGAEFLTFLTALFLLLPVIKRLAGLGAELRTALTAYERLARVGIDTESPELVPPLPSAKVSAPHIAIVGVTIHDDDGGTLLDNISVEVEPGCLSVVTGPTGAGKSLLLELTAGIVFPSVGTVSVARDRLGYVPQDGWAIRGTVSENVALGRGLDETAIARALHEAALHSVSPEMILGERGAPLSGGERQRLALARALAGDPNLLVLDEPTSALDGETEAAIIESILQRRGTSTILIATHRPAFISAADVLIRLDAGRVVSAKMFEQETAE